MTNVVEAGAAGAVKVTVWDLAMTADPGVTAEPRDDLVILYAAEPAPELARFFYEEVGREFNWRGRMDWTRSQWQDEADAPTNHLHSCWSHGSPAGYFMLDENTEDTVGNTELKYFGLLPRFHGRGIGKWLLTRAIETAWALPTTERFWLHTCSLDGPHAKANYLARGFVEVGQKLEYQLIIPPD
ncbi:MAG: GNAT family N-acetyltransferase [Actinomycetota bacterium]